MANLLFIDVETTGTDPKVHGIWSLSGVFVQEDEILETFHFDMNPGQVQMSQFFFDHGCGPDIMKTYPPQWEVCSQFYNLLERKHQELGDKFIICGYRIQFDIDFVFAWMRKNQKYLLSHCHSGYIDLLSTATLMTRNVRSLMPNMKLETVCRLLKIDIDAHDSRSDINATVQIYLKIFKYLNLNR